MAKRRNLKKEKAERNKAYARQFRQNTSRYGNRRNNSGYGGYKKQDNEQQTSQDNNE